MHLIRTARSPYSAFLLAFFCAFACFAQQPAWADPSDASGQKVLNGSLQDKEKMESSLKLLVSPPESSTPTPPMKLNVQQFSGGTQYSPGQPAPALPRPVLNSGVGFQFRNPQFRQPPAFVPTFRPPPVFVPRVVPRWNYTMTPRNGIMTYGAGYGTQRVAQPRILSTHANLSLSFPNTQVAVQQTNLQLLQTNSHVINWAPPVVQLKATQLSLMQPQKRPRLSPPINWEEWYQRVARAIYNEWRENAIGPGKTTLLITVFNTCYVDCKVIDFTPAAGAQRDAKGETAFRESALRCITGLDRDPIWQFPVAAIHPKKIVFDMQFDHAVGATPGCAVIHTHSNVAMRALQR